MPLPLGHSAVMNVWLILHAVMISLNDGVRTGLPTINYQELLFVSFVFFVSLEAFGYQVVHVFPDSENNSRLGCRNDFVNFLTSKNHHLDEINTYFKFDPTVSGDDLSHDINNRIEHREMTLLPQLSSGLFNTRIQTGLVVLRSHLNPRTAYSSPMAEKKKSSKYPLAVINIHVPQTPQSKRIKKDADIFISQRPKQSRNPKTTKKQDDHNLASVPWNTLWILQEFRALRVPSNYLVKKSGETRALHTSKHEVKKRSNDHSDLAVLPWQALWLLQSERTECNFPGKVLRIDSVLKDIEMNEWLRPNPEESLGNCPVRFRPLVDPNRWLPRNLVSRHIIIIKSVFRKQLVIMIQS